MSSLLTNHNDVALQLAKKESAEHRHGLTELQAVMRQRPLRVKAWSVNHAKAPPAIYSKTCPNIKTVHFIRHGQGFHNLMADQAAAAGKTWKQFDPTDTNNPYIMPELVDAPLTEKGRQQAALLQPKIAAFHNKEQPLQLIVSSPNCRALQTGIIAFEHFLNDVNIPFVAHEMVREEHGVHCCDKRRSVARQRVEFPQVDFGLLEDDQDVLYRNDVRESKLEIGNRIYSFLQWLSAKNDVTHIGVCSHSSWLLALFNGVLDCGDDASLLDWFQTGEMRSVRLEFIHEDENQDVPGLARSLAS